LTVLASIFTDFWNHQLVEHDRQGVFLVLAGFIGSFAFIRMSTRISRSPRFEWWPGSVVSDSGVHVHHLVFGICTMMAAGTLGFLFFEVSPWFEIVAIFFGIGVGLTVDEFALWVYLDDVYWAEEGRGSIDATVLAAVGMLLVLFGVRPFEVATDTALDLIVSLVGLVLLFGVVAMCFLKQRVLHGTIGFLLFPVAVYGASRIGKPGSPWGRRFYGDRTPAKQAKAEQRFRPDRRTEQVKKRFRDAVGGTPTEEYEAKIARQAAGGGKK
jgi:hypothetical protein